jgi:anti-anti-sigma factor
MKLKIKVNKKINHVYVVRCYGPLDSVTYKQLEDELDEIISGDIKALFLDMKGVDYISSIGIKVILLAEKNLKRKNAAFAMVNLQPQIKKVLDAVKILSIVNIFDDMEEADMYIDQIIKDEIKKEKVQKT